MFEKLDYVAFSNNAIDLDDKDSDIVTFFTDDTDHNTINLININLDGDNRDDDDTESIINVRLWVGVIYINNVRHVKKQKQKIDGGSVASNKMVRQVRVRR